MKTSTFIHSTVMAMLFVFLNFPNSSHAIPENKYIGVSQLQGINFQQLDSNICQNINQIEVPSINEYPLEVSFDIKSINLPFNDYMYKNHKYPPIVVICLFSIFLVALKLKKVTNNNFIKKTLVVFSVTAFIGFILIIFAWSSLHYINNKVTKKEQIDTYIKMSPYITQ